jgi:hypothetical protein
MKRHGGPYDRGAADSYYRRKFRPHFWKGREEVIQLTEEERADYAAGFDDNEKELNFKEYER